MILGLGLYVFVFLWLFRPDPILTERQRVVHLLGYGGLAAAAMAFNVLLLPHWWPAPFRQWTLRKYALFHLWNIVLTGLLVTLFNWAVLFEWGDLALLLSDQKDTALVGLIPIAIITLLIYPPSPVADPPAETKRDSEQRWTIETDTSESLALDLAAIRFAQARDNYVEVAWREGPGLRRRLLRLSLSRLEEQLPTASFFRCHRSYLINLQAVERIEGNRSRMKVTLHDVPEPLPVSRSYIEPLLKLLDRP